MNTKFLLTSGGIKNKTLENELKDLVGKDFSDVNFLYVLTAQNTESGYKGWLIDNLREFQQIGFKQVDLIDVAIQDTNLVLKKIKEADIVCFGGGNSLYLLTVLHRNGILQNFGEVFKDKVYMGISAGSIILGPNLKGDDDINELSNLGIKDIYNGKEFNIFDFVFIPHLNSIHFPQYSEASLCALSKNTSSKMYCLDDNSALKVVDGVIEIVGEGKSFVLNDD